jgi:alginate production protein
MKLTILSHNLSSNGRFGRRVRPPLAANASLRRHRSGLTRRPDERRPAEQLTLMLLERPLTIGGELKAASEYKGNFSLTKNPKDDVLSLKQKLQLELLYPLTENTSLFLEGEATYEAEPFSEATSLKPKRAIERGQTWLFVGNLLQSNFSLQIGRQSLSDRRSWWWDEDLDAVRLHYDLRRLHAELTLAQQMGNISTDPHENKPTADHVLRLLGNTAWLWTRDQRLDGFFLYQNDHSSRQSIGQLVKNEREDPSDATLLWLGARASGELDLDRLGDLSYWLDGAWVGGRERLLDFKKDKKRKNHLRVSSRLKRNVAGWGLDTGLSWETKLPWHPTLTLGYAFGSGDRTPERGTDHSFRQTGLQANKVRFGGVTRFRYYGELLDPELSNLHIWTAALGFRFWRSSSIEFLYHFYRQVYPAPFLRDSRLKADPEGKGQTIGQEWDMVIGLRGWEHLEVEFSSGLFRAGSAYGPLSGETAYITTLKVKYNF